MVTNAERLGLWDDELERLTTQAAAIHGDEALSRAVNHALRQLVARRKTPVSFSAIKAALKTELRRLLQPH